MRTAGRRTISIILLFIVSTMLIGIFSSCKIAPINEDADTESSIQNTSYDTDKSSETINSSEPFPVEYFEFMPDLEPLSYEEMLYIKELWATFWYNYYFNREYEIALAAGNDEKTAKKISEEINKGVFEDFYDYLFYDHYKYRYYGIINDCIVIERRVSVGEATTYSFDDIEIYCTGYICVFVENEIIMLDEAYEKGYIDYDDVEQIKIRQQLYKEEYNR